MRILLKLILAICLSVSLIACKTVDGPRHPIPSQDIAGAVPDGLSRVVLFNTSNRLLYFESGPIRIQLDGQQLPSIWLDHYVQAFVEPGTYELKLEHYDMVFWKATYEIEINAPEVFLEVYNTLVSTKYRRIKALPDDFHARFKSGRDPANW